MQTEKQSKIIQAVLLFLFVTVVLVPGFYRNQWQTAGKKRFPEWRMNSNHMLIGRLAHSRQFGVFSSGALLGTVDGGWPTPPGIVEHQYDVYLNKIEHTSFFTYNSAIGFQGILFSLFDLVTNYPENYNLKIFSGVTAVLSAIMMALIVVWIFIQVGFLPAIFVFGFIFLSEWITLFSGDIYWQLWAFYLPTVIVFYYYALSNNHKIQRINLPILVFLSVLIKILFNGFEFITTTLVMIYTPLVYYSLVQRWPLKNLFNLLIKIGVSAVAAVVAGLGILIMQLSAVLGGLLPALAYVNATVLRRTYGNSSLQPFESGGQDTSLLKVLWTYISGRAFNLQFLTDLAPLSSLENVSYLAIFIIFLVATITFLLLSLSKDKIFDRKTWALLGAMWFSVTSALSWFILFKGHSLVHTHLNYIVWQMPFTIMGFAFVGVFIQEVICYLKTKLSR